MVVDILEEMGSFNIIGVTTVNQDPGSLFQGYPVLGDDRVLPDYIKKGIKLAAMGVGGFVSNENRKKVFNNIKALGLTVVNVIHPSAIISKTVKLGEGIILFPGVILNTDVKVGDNTIIATGSTIDHETILGNHVLVSAGVTVGANTIIEDNVLLALGSKVISGVKIKKNVLVGAGAAVVNDIQENKKVLGVPAKERNV